MLDAIRRAENPQTPTLISATELEKFLPRDFLEKIGQVDKHHLGIKDSEN